MITITEPSALRYHSPNTRLPKSRMTDARTATTVTTLPSELRHPHPSSLVSTPSDYLQRPIQPAENYHLFSRTMLKNKSLLVPTRLALKRQRASIKAPLRALESVESQSFQMELGNPDELLIHWNSQQDEPTEEDPPAGFSPEHQTFQNSSHFRGPLRVNTPYNAPADIALLYK